MKRMKKLASLLLALVLAMSMAMTAFAASDTGDAGDAGTVSNEFTVKLTGEAKTPTTGHKYDVYQIFTGDLSKEGDVVKLSNVKYGKNYGIEGEEVLKTVLEDIRTKGADEFAKELVEGSLGTAYGTLNEDNGWALEEVPAGYYLIVDTTDDLPDGHERSRYIVEVVDDVDIEPKSGVLTVIKKVDDNNDSTGAENSIVWHDSADHDLGDMIDFKIETTLPDDLMTYDTYELTLHDTQSPGLDFKAETVKVYLNNSETPLVDGYKVVTANKEDNTCTFEVKFADVTALEGVGNGSKITVRYQSQLNAEAVIGFEGNPNTVYGEFSNSYFPNDKGRTPDDTVIVFTYKVNVDKYKEAVEGGNELSGAGFTLYKEVVADSEGKYPTEAKTGAVIKDALNATNPSIKAAALKDASRYIERAVTTTDAAGDTFGFERIDDGTYVLVETTIPAGYNAWNAVEFVVTAEHDTESDAPTLTKLTGGDLLKGDVGTCILDIDVINNAGTTLPETGGMGTTLFYAIGAILVLGSAVVLITKKRMGEN